MHTAGAPPVAASHLLPAAPPVWRAGAAQRVAQRSLPPGDVASEPAVELARPAAAGLMSAAQAAVRLSGGDWGTMIWTTKVKGALLCL